MESKGEQGEREKDGAGKSEEDRQEPCEKRKGYSVSIGSGTWERRTHKKERDMAQA